MNKKNTLAALCLASLMLTAPAVKGQDTCETAFAFGDRTGTNVNDAEIYSADGELDTFLGDESLGEGWELSVFDGDDFTVPIYVGAGSSDISEGTHVGDLTVLYKDGMLSVSFDMLEGFSLNRHYLYVGNGINDGADHVPASAPAGYKRASIGTRTFTSHSRTYTVDLGEKDFPSSLYLVFHSVVCGEGSASSVVCGSGDCQSGGEGCQAGSGDCQAGGEGCQAGGATGPQGATGAQGADGERGPQGATGAQGADGLDGERGPQGATGAQGADGERGPQGATGAQGADGERGPQGATGAQGADGEVVINFGNCPDNQVMTGITLEADGRLSVICEDFCNFTCPPIVDEPPSIRLEETGTYNDTDGDGYADVGETITYSYTVTNTGNVTLSNVTLTDPLITVTGGPIELAPGASDSSTFTGTYIITQADIDAGNVPNTTTATGAPPTGTDVSDDANYNQPLTQPPAAIQLEKRGTFNDEDGDGYADAEETITYSFTVTNTGGVTLSNVTLENPSITVSGGPIPTLAPGASDSSTFTGTYTITQADIDAGKVLNTTTAEGAPPSGTDVSDDDKHEQPLTPEPEKTACVVIIDEDSIDNGTSTIEAAAARHGIQSDVLVNDDHPTETGNPWLEWNESYSGDLVKLPTGQVEDEGWFALPSDWSSQKVQDFAEGKIPQSQLDKIPNVMPIRNQELAKMVGKTCVAVVYDSDISMNYDPINGNLQGARLGRFAFTVEGVEVAGSIDESKSDRSLYDVWVTVEAPIETVEPYNVPVNEKPDSIQVESAKYNNSKGKLTVIAKSPEGSKANMTVSVDGSDAGGDHNVDPFLLEEVIPHDSGEEFKLVYKTTTNLKGRRLSIQTDLGGAYNKEIE